MDIDSNERHIALLELHSGLTTLIGVFEDRRLSEDRIAPRRQQLATVESQLTAYTPAGGPPAIPAPFDMRSVMVKPLPAIVDQTRPPVSIELAMLSPPTADTPSGESLLERLVNEQYRGLMQ